MSSRQLRSKGESDGLSLLATTRKGIGKKSSDQPEMEQQTLRPVSTQLASGESATPAAGQVERSSSTPPRDTGLMLLPPVNVMP